ncbi:GntR family transcriptional regulator [Paenibacillus sp. CAU 1782]
MLISLKLQSEVPLYEQLRNEIVLGIAKGQLQPEEKLPTVRQLADELGINNMTVNKAYALLKQEGYLVIDRRHGAKVSLPSSKQANQDHPSEQLEQKLELMVAEAALHGVTAEAFNKLCSSIYRKMHILNS